MGRELNYILAYIGKRSIKGILSTGETIYNVNTANQTPYSPTHRLDIDEDEWFYIENFRLSDFNSPITKIGNQGIKIEELFTRITELHQLQSRDYRDIKWLITKQGACYYFQKVLSSNKIESKTFLWMDRNPAIYEIKNSVEIPKEHPDMIYDSTNDRLIFKSFSRAKDMFPELISLYREATNEELDRFITSRAEMSVVRNFDMGIRNRKEVARLLPKIEALSDRAKETLRRYVDDHIDKTELKKGDDGKIIISNPQDFKEYLSLLDERFVTSEIYGEDRVITAFTTS